MQARHGDGLDGRHAEIDDIQDRLQHRADDDAATRCAGHQPRRAILEQPPLEQHGGNHARGPRLAGLNGVAAAGNGVKQLHGVVVNKAKPWCDHTRAGAKGMGARGRVACLVVNANVCRAGIGRVFAIAKEFAGADPLGPHGGAVLGKHHLHRDVGEVRIGEIFVAVPVRRRHGAGDHVDMRRRAMAHRGQVEMLQYLQHLDQRYAAARRWVRGDIEAAILAPHRRQGLN